MRTPAEDRPLVSAIVVNYNSLEFLKPCVASLRHALAGLDAEIIVVDNCSTDGSREWLAATTDVDRAILSPDNLGFGRGNNLAIRDSAGQFVLLVNPDTVATGDCVRSLLQFLAGEKGAQAGAAGPTVTSVDGAFYRQCARNFPDPRSGAAHVFPWLAPWVPPAKPYFSFTRPPDQATRIECLSGSAMMIRRECLDRIGLFDEDYFLYAEDIDLCKRMADAGWSVWYVPTDPLVHHSGGSSEKRSRFGTMHFYRSAALYYRKHFMRGRRVPRLLDMIVLAGLRIRLALDLAAITFGTKTQVGSVKPRERSA